MKGADALKLLLSLVVVWIHAGTSNLRGLTGVAVPVFFVLSGFFLYGKVLGSAVEQRPFAVALWWKKVLYLYLVWTVIYLPFAVYGFMLDQSLPAWKAPFAWLRNVLFRGENYLSWPLWYLLGLLQAGAVIWAFEKFRFPFWLLCLLGLGLWLLPHFVDMSTLPVWSRLMRTTGDGFTVGLPFMLLGGVVRRLFPSIRGWSPANSCYRAALRLRFISTHIYLTHMLFVGPLLFLGLPRGVVLWALAVAWALVSGVFVLRSPRVCMALYGRRYV